MEEGYEDKGVGRKGGPPVTAARNLGCKGYIAKGRSGDEFARFVRNGAELSMEIKKRYGDKGPPSETRRKVCQRVKRQGPIAHLLGQRVNRQGPPGEMRRKIGQRLKRQGPSRADRNDFRPEGRGTRAPNRAEPARPGGLRRPRGGRRA